ncbi:MAG: tetratricopeptide repeat protein [Saprospiraceae bacterium]|nr:tetratricopeptide repeat protein [Saprospiraceae bacterium]
MIKLYCILLFVFLQFGHELHCQERFEMTFPLKDAFKDINSLKIKSGRKKLIMVRISDPGNALVYYVENYIDFYTLFIQEDESEYKLLLKNKELRLNKIKKSDSSSPYYLYCQAEIILQWATIKLKFGDRIDAALDVYEAYNLLKKNRDKFPDFVENNKSLSVIHAISESVPGWIKKIMGINGSVDMGTKEISILASKAFSEQSIFKEEIVAIYSYILFYANNKKEEAYQLFDKYQIDHKSNPLVTFLKATMAQKIGKNEEAIRILQERPQGPEYLPFYYLDFMYGKFKLYRLDRDADKYIVRFLDNFKGKHYIKEAWQKLAWSRVAVYNDTEGYKKYMNSCKMYGQTLIDEDVQAMREAKENQIPNTILLKARLLFDGGYYTKAQNLLIINGYKFANAIHDGEYYYRLARVTDALKNYVDALDYYDLTIAASDPGKYYACSAALNAGLICEQQQKFSRAKIYFEKCINLDPAGYTSSLHAKAKSGLSRVKEK